MYSSTHSYPPALWAGEWWTSSPGCFIPDWERFYPLNRGLDGPQRPSGRFEGDKLCCLCREFVPRTVQRVANCTYRYIAILTVLMSRCAKCCNRAARWTMRILVASREQDFLVSSRSPDAHSYSSFSPILADSFPVVETAGAWGWPLVLF